MSPESKVAAPVGGVDVLAVMDGAALWCIGKSAVGSDLNLREARAAVAELVAAAEAMEERIAYYAEMGESAEVNIEDWAYTDNSGDMARLRAALAPFQTGGAE